MKLSGIDIDSTLKELELNLALEKDLSPTLRSLIGILILVVKLLTNRVGLNSQNSSKPPASDPNRLKTSRKKSGNKPGGQLGHVGTTLKQIAEPDEIAVIEIDRRALPRGRYKEVGFEKRQVFDIYVTRNVIEYQAQILEDEAGARFVAQFPEGVDKAVQYGNSLKAHAVYMSQYQLLPYNRVQEYFTEQLQIPISQGSIFNFNQEAFERLTEFSAITKEKLISSSRLHVDEPKVGASRRPASTLKAGVTGYTAPAMIYGLTSLRIKSVAARRWMKEDSVTIIGSHITDMLLVCMRCAMPII